MNNATDRIRLFRPGLLAEEQAKVPRPTPLLDALCREVDEAERRRRALDAVRKPTRGPLWQ